MRLALVLVAAAGLLVVEVGGKRGKRGKRSRHPRPGAGEGPLPPPTVDANEDGWEDDTGWLPRALLQQRCDFTRTTAGSLTAESFAESFAGRKPLLIEGLAEGWSAGRAWSAPELLRTHGSHLVLHEEPSHVAQFGAGDVHPDQVEVSGEKQSSLQGWLRRQRLSRGEGGSLVCKCSSGSAFSVEPEAAAARSRQVGGHHRPVIAAGGSFCGRTAAAGCGGGGRTLI